MIETKEQIYGRNDMVMLDKHNKIYGSLGMAEQYVFNTVEGNPVILRHPKEGKLKDVATEFEMQGWTEQAQYEGKNLFDATKDINVSYDGMVNTEYNTYIGNGSIEISAENLRQQSKGKQLGEFNGKTLCLSLTAREGKVAIVIFSNGTLKENRVFEIGARESVYFIVDSENYVFTFAKATYGSKNVVAENIMMNEGSTAMPYEPYTGGAPSPSPDYPQEIVSAGKYDEASRKYQYTIKISDSEESPTKSQTVTLTADRPLTKWDRMEKRFGQWGWVYKSAEIVLDGSEDEKWKRTTGNTFTFIIDIPEMNFNPSFCNRYRWKEAVWVSSDYGVYSDNGYDTKYFRPPSADVETVEQWKTFLSQNPLTVVCGTEEETFVPLSASEQEQMNELTMNTPTTVISNDVEANMKITYKSIQTEETVSEPTD